MNNRIAPKSHRQLEAKSGNFEACVEKVLCCLLPKLRYLASRKPVHYRNLDVITKRTRGQLDRQAAILGRVFLALCNNRNFSGSLKP